MDRGSLATWVASSASFIPSAPQRELRELTRYRVRLSEERAREVNRVQKTLKGCNLKLGDVVSDVVGKASRLILQAIADGESDPARLASLAVGRVRASQEELEAALTGKAKSSQDQEATKEGSQAAASSAEQERSWEGAVRIAMSLPGIAERAATGILAEIGINMQQFPTDAHLARLGSASAQATMRVRANGSRAKRGIRQSLGTAFVTPSSAGGLASEERLSASAL